MSHHREPIGHTCPQIDKYIKSIKMEIYREQDLKRLNEEEIYEVASSMNSELERCIDYLEELRTANDRLRCWGIEEADGYDKLEEKISQLEEIN